MDLPQTEPGVPAAGIDPTIAELGNLNPVAGIFDWLGTAEPARAAFVAALGGGTPRLRDIVYIKGTDFDNSVAGILLVHEEGHQPSLLTPSQLGHMAMLRRISRLRLGLRAVEIQGPQPPPPAATGVGFPGLGALAVAGAPTPPLPTS